MAMDDRGPQVRDVTIAFLVLPWIAVSARCWVRLKILKAFAVDDFLAIATLLFLTIYASLMLAGIAHGVGKHVWELTTEQRITSMKIWYYGEIIYIMTAALLRLAVGAFLLRIAIRSVHRRIIYGLLALNVIFNLFYLVFTVFQCTPIDGFWLRAASIENAAIYKCRTDISVDSTFASSGISAFIDWAFGILPVFILWELNVNLKKKIGLGVIMGLGVLASAGPLVRIPYTVNLRGTEDFLFDTVDVGIWSFLEPGLGLTVISILTLRPLFVQVFRICSTDHSDGMSIGEMPSRHTKPQFWQTKEAYDGRHICISGGQDDQAQNWSPELLVDDIHKKSGPKKYGTAIRMTCEIRSVSDVGIVEVRSPIHKPSDSIISREASWV